MSHFWTILLQVFTGLIALLALGYLLLRWMQRSQEDPGRLVLKWIVTGLVILFIATILGPQVEQGDLVGAFTIPAVAFCGVILAIVWVPNITAYFAKPFVELYTGGDRAPDPQAFYSIAEAKRKRGNYQEAVAEIRKELALFPNDFSGQMLLAEILADDLKDLAQAQFTLEQLLSQEGHTPKNLAYAMNRLADWHLKLGRDPAAAQQALERITRQFPNTELAYLASQRIAHLGPFQAADKEAKPRTVVLKHYEENLGLREDFTGLKAPPEDNTGAAADLVKRLEECPTDNEARERLARLYAERFARLDLAADQLEQLIAQPGAPTRQVVHWLNLLADNQIKLAGNLVAARQALQRIVDRFPNSSEADKARQRMCFLGLELKGQQQGQAVKLGSYDQYPGLKPEWPEGPPGPKS